MNKIIQDYYVNSIFMNEKTDFNIIQKEYNKEKNDYSDSLFSPNTLLRLAIALPKTRKLYSDIRNELDRYSLLRLEKTDSFDNYYYKKKLILRIRVYYDHLLMMFFVNKKKIAFSDYSNLHEYLGEFFLPTNIYSEIDNKNIDLYKYLFSFLVKKYKLVRIKKKQKTFNIDKPYFDYLKDINLKSQDIIDMLGYSSYIIDKTTHREAKSLPDSLAFNAIVPIEDKVYKREVSHTITVGELSVGFKEKYTITLDLLKKVGLAEADCNYLKVIETGGCKYPIDVIANEFSIEASKMLLITGGNLYRIVSKE